MKEKFSLKEALFNQEKVTQLSNEIREVYPSFASQLFIDEVLEKFPLLELKERIYHIRDSLCKHLPQEYEEALKIILKALPPELDPTKNDDDFGDFIYAPYGEFVTAYGCSCEHLSFSLDALAEITKRFSVEFAIREFINRFPIETLSMLHELSGSSNYHQRRLTSEGLRPKLPWGKGLTLEYREAMKLLDNLFYDPTRYVTRSVANHLNDVSKVDAPLVINTLKRWKESGKQEAKEMEFLATHALRTLVKVGDKEALEFLGYPSNPKIDVGDLMLMQEKVKVGEALDFTCRVEAKEESLLMVDYILYFQTKNGTLRPKVHKLKRLHLKKGESMLLKKRHLFKANMTTRKLYDGLHRIAIQINGKVYGEGEFFLVQF